MESIINTLNKLNVIRLKYEMLSEKEEKFNIFSVLHKDNDERRLHSRFIANLLAPDASHKKNKRFLFIFLELMKIDIEKFKQVEVYPKEWNKKENSNIDILIIDRVSKNAVIIENKINASDSNSEDSGQLERYFNHIKKIEKIPEKNITTIYLTLDKHLPSTESLGGYKTLDRINGVCISYPNEIVKWLNECLKETIDKPFLREAIIQYTKLIEKMTGNEMDIMQRIEIKEFIGKNQDTMNATKMLIDNFKHVKWHTIFDFWENLATELQNKGYNVISKPDKQNIIDLTHFESYRKGQTNKQNFGICFNISEDEKYEIWNETDEYLYFGLKKDEIITNIVTDKINYLIETTQYYTKNEHFYFYNEFFDNDSDKLVLSDFSSQATFNLIQKDNQDIVIKKIIETIEEYEKIIKSR